MTELEKYLRLLLIVLINRNHGKITIKTDDINSINLNTDIIETRNPDATITLEIADKSNDRHTL